MLQLHHLHGSPVPTSDLRGQVLPKDRHLFAIRRANMRRKVSLSTVFTAVRSKQEQVGKLACSQPRHPAAVIHPPECQASVTIEAVPAQVGFLESFAAHGLHGIPEDCLHMSDFYRHARSEVRPTSNCRAGCATHSRFLRCVGFVPILSVSTTTVELRTSFDGKVG